MAEFQEVAKAYVRMCESYSTCEGCPIQAPGNDIDSCRCCVFKWPEKYESKIMKWAAENPEMVYPTWVEWLSKQGFVKLNEGQFVRQTENEYIYECKTVAILTDKAAAPIPADTAKKLGIEPKGSCDNAENKG